MDKLLERWAGIPQQQRYLIIGAVISGVFVFYWWFFYSQAQVDLKNLIDQRAQLSQDRNRQVQYVQRISEYKAKFDRLEQELDKMRDQLPDEADVPQLLAQLDNAARESGLSIVSFKPTGETARGFYSEVGVDMEVLGSYHEIGTFVDAVGKLDRIVNVKNISMTNPKTENQQVVLKSKFSIKTYRFIDSGGANAKK